MANSKKFEKGPPLFLIHRSARATGHTCSAYAKRTTCYSRIPPPGARSLTRFQKGFTSAVQYGDLRSISKNLRFDPPNPLIYTNIPETPRGIKKTSYFPHIFDGKKSHFLHRGWKPDFPGKSWGSCGIFGIWFCGSKKNM